MKIFRQGDLGITPLEKMPDNLKKVYQGNKYILAYGEATGHKHTLVSSPLTKFEILEDEKGQKYLKLDEPTELIHDEHGTIKIERGAYIVHQEREYNYFDKEIEIVRD